MMIIVLVVSKGPGGTTVVTAPWSLNGVCSSTGSVSYAKGINWQNWKGFYYSLKFTEMKVRQEN